MPDEIWGNRFMSRDIPAWHYKGTVFHDDPTAEEALKIIKGDRIAIDKVPAMAMVGANEFVVIPDQYALMRRPTDDDPEWRNFGIVGPRYTVLQNEQIAQIVDMMIEGTKDRGKWKLETAGILRNGETIFFALKSHEVQIAGEDVGMYFGISDQRNGGSSVDIAATPIRYVCANTLRLGLDKADSRITIRHHSDLFAETAWRVDLIAKAVSSGESMLSALRKLEKIAIDESTMAGIVDTLFPMPKMPRSIELKASGDYNLAARGETAEYQYEWRKATTEKSRAEVLENFRYLNDTNEGIAYTGWSAFNSITGWIDHQSGKNTDNGKRVMAERSLSAEMDELRTRAYKLIIQAK